MQEEMEFKRGTVYAFNKLAQHSPGIVRIQRILKKITGELNVLTMDAQQFMDSKFSPFDTYVHVFDGKAEVIINKGSMFVSTGEFIIIPGHSRNTLQAILPTKLLQLTIKSGYEQVL